MTTIVYKDLPHKVGTAEIASPELKKVTMQFMENFLALGGQVSALQQVAAELQRAVAERSLAPSGGGGGDEPSGGGDEPSGGGDDSGGDAADRAARQATIAQQAADRAVLAAVEARTAANSAAEAAASAQWSTAFAIRGVQMNPADNDDLNTAANVKGTFDMSSLVPDTSKDYDVTVTFTNESATSRSCWIRPIGGVKVPVSLGNSFGAKESETVQVSGNGKVKINNANQTTVGVAVKIALVAQGG